MLCAEVGELKRISFGGRFCEAIYENKVKSVMDSTAKWSNEALELKKVEGLSESTKTVARKSFFMLSVAMRVGASEIAGKVSGGGDGKG